ncbi:MAG: penicillin-binding protein activator LpoB [Zoogloeaceae bacterium]|jgi:uncharacterized protein (TIGR02722 family)|nr:penicillin-binding protein activator LpoB [Zoogloeaceae bacterium]
MKSSALFAALFAAATLSLSGCGGVSYGDPNAEETLTTDLGSTDVQRLSEKLTESLRQSPVIQQAISDKTLIVASAVQNKTSEYFDTHLITDRILTALAKDGLRYVIESDNMQNQIDELDRQASEYYDQQSTTKIGQMKGARYRLDGSLSSIVKKDGRKKDVYYVMNLRLIDIATGIVEWSDEQEIRKTKS